MKLFLLAFFVAAAVAIPIPDDGADGNIEVIVNGVPEGEALDIGHIVDIRAQEKVNGYVVATSNVLHPFSPQGIAEAAAAAEAEAAAAAETETEAVAPETPVIPEIPILPELGTPEAVVMPESPAPEVVGPVVPEIEEPINQGADNNVPTPVVLPEAPAPVVAEPVVIPEPITPGVVPESPVTPVEVADAAEVPEPAPQPELQTGEIFNNNLVSMTVNAENPSLLSTLQNWLNVVVNYVTSGGNAVQTTQIV